MGSIRESNNVAVLFITNSRHRVVRSEGFSISFQRLCMAFTLKAMDGMK